jgi:hypothetical protein
MLGAIIYIYIYFQEKKSVLHGRKTTRGFLGIDIYMQVVV